MMLQSGGLAPGAAGGGSTMGLAPGAGGPAPGAANLAPGSGAAPLATPSLGVAPQPNPLLPPTIAPSGTTAAGAPVTGTPLLPVLPRRTRPSH